MARIHLYCRCGWKFFVPDTTEGRGVACPSCGAPVALGTDASPTGRSIAAARSSHALFGLLYKVLGAVVVLGAVAALFLSTRPVPVAPATRPRPAALPPQPPPVAELPRPAPATRPERPAPPPAPPAEPDSVRLAPAENARLRRSVSQTACLLNLGGIVSEILRLRGLPDEHAKLTARIEEWNAELSSALARLARHGERLIAEPHFQPGDRIVEFARINFGALVPPDAANVLAHWLAGFRPPTPSEHVVFLREGRRIPEYISFAEETEGLRRLLQTPGIAPTTAPPGGASGPLPEELLLQADRRLGELPKGYRDLLPEGDRRRLEALLASRQGNANDAAFLEVRIVSEALPQLEKDALAVRSRAAELEAKIRETTAVDVLHFKDGRRLEGQLVEEGEKTVKFRGRFGSVQYPREEVLRVERGKGGGLEFPERLKASGRKPEGLVPLLSWCREKKLGLETEFVAYLILTMDPLNDEARTAAGLRRPALRR